MKKNMQGFTLIEVMIAVVIVGILASVAYPSYVNQIFQSRRSDGHLGLLTAAQKLERCKTTTFTYASCNVIDSDSESPEGYYALSIDNVSAVGYELIATPQDAQAGDEKCGNLTLDANGTRGASGILGEGCW
ncbi:MAG TPA: methylation site containing protein [Gammaproteobacteria bacterium]|jgi:type IV pilus assembly protein PilE|nr:methylation site containing protein [Gammaproteobacteria bacterium]